MNRLDKWNLPGFWPIQRSSWRWWEHHVRKLRSQRFQWVVLQFQCQKRPKNQRNWQMSFIHDVRHFYDILFTDSQLPKVVFKLVILNMLFKSYIPYRLGLDQYPEQQPDRARELQPEPRSTWGPFWEWPNPASSLQRMKTFTPKPTQRKKPLSLSRQLKGLCCQVKRELPLIFTPTPSVRRLRCLVAHRPSNKSMHGRFENSSEIFETWKNYWFVSRVETEQGKKRLQKLHWNVEKLLNLQSINFG